MLKNAKQIFDLLKSQHIEEYHGEITLNLMNLSVKLADRSAIGYVLQEWFAAWLKQNRINFEVNENTQEFPDFYLLPQTYNKNLLELKTFDLDAGANFDVANFEAYCRSLLTKSYRLDADYLIFGYTFNESDLIIKKIWLKKIWEITSPSEAFPIKTQNKQGMIYNIRPCVWESRSATYKAFNSKKAFFEALYETLKKYKKTSKKADAWKREVSRNYKSFNGESLL